MKANEDVRVTPLLRARGALLGYDDSAFASHATAARVLGLPIPVLPDEHVTVIERRHRHRRAGVAVHHVRSAQVTVVDRVRISAPVQVFVELSTLVSLIDLVVVGDDLARRHRIAPAALRAHCVESRLPGAAAARRAAAYVREHVDSPMETRTRMLLLLAGLPEPEVNPTLRDEHGEPVRRYDLYYRCSRTVIEYDGRQHIEREVNWEADLRRREAIDGDGDRIIVVTSRDLHRAPGHVLDRIHQVLLQRREPGVPRRLSLDWQPHFPGWRG